MCRRGNPPVVSWSLCAVFHLAFASLAMAAASAAAPRTAKEGESGKTTASPSPAAGHEKEAVPPASPVPGVDRAGEAADPGEEAVKSAVETRALEGDGENRGPEEGPEKDAGKGAEKDAKDGPKDGPKNGTETGPGKGPEAGSETAGGKSADPQRAVPISAAEIAGDRPEGQPREAAAPAGDAGTVRLAAPPAIRLDFQGGSLREFLDAVQRSVRETPGLRCNVAVNDPAAAEAVKLPRIVLEEASVETAMQIASLVAGKRDHVISIDRLALPDEHPTFVVLIEEVERKAPAPPARELQVFSLDEFLGNDAAADQDSKQLESVLAAIQLALDLRNPREAAKTVLRFHPESRLLIATGLEDQIEVVRSVVSRVSEARSSRRQRRTLRQENEKLRAQLQDLRSRLRTQETERLRRIDELETSVVKLEADLAAAQRQADQSREYYEKARRGREAEFEKLLAQKISLEAEVRNAERIVAELTRQVAELKKQRPD